VVISDKKPNLSLNDDKCTDDIVMEEVSVGCEISSAVKEQDCGSDEAEDGLDNSMAVDEGEEDLTRRKFGLEDDHLIKLSYLFLVVDKN
ncbi:hypothetical protein Tco_1450626, partial [Tanacetum coccineum]